MLEAIVRSVLMLVAKLPGVFNVTWKPGEWDNVTGCEEPIPMAKDGSLIDGWQWWDSSTIIIRLKKSIRYENEVSSLVSLLMFLNTQNFYLEMNRCFFLATLRTSPEASVDMLISDDGWGLLKPLELED